MGRAPCCDKANVKRGPWSPEEDEKLKSHIEQHGTGGNWITLPQKIGMSCYITRRGSNFCSQSSTCLCACVLFVVRNRPQAVR